MAEGRIPFSIGETWYRSVEPERDEGRVPLLCLHGGPGANWLHLKPYEALADERRVVFYDQLGAGRAALPQPPDAAVWAPPPYVQEGGAGPQAPGLRRASPLRPSLGGRLARH